MSTSLGVSPSPRLHSWRRVLPPLARSHRGGELLLGIVGNFQHLPLAPHGAVHGEPHAVVFTAAWHLGGAVFAGIDSVLVRCFAAEQAVGFVRQARNERDDFHVLGIGIQRLIHFNLPNFKFPRICIISYFNKKSTSWVAIKTLSTKDILSIVIYWYTLEMRLISWNINGLRAVHNKGLFLPFIKKEKPDILCLQETKAEQGQAEIDLPEYEEYWNSAKKKGYSGTAIFTKVKPVSISLGFPEKITKKYKLAVDGYGNPNEEGRVVTTEFDSPAGGFFLVNCYTPNAKGDLSRLNLRHKQWDPAFLAYVKELDAKKPVIFCGDLNVAHTEDDLAHPKENEGDHGFTKEERGGIDNIIKAGFVDTFRHFTPKGKGHYTWWSNWSNARARNVGWRIDYFFVSKRLVSKVKKAEILPAVMGSDHCPVSITIEI